MGDGETGSYIIYLVAKKALNELGNASLDKSVPGHVFIGGKTPNGRLEAYGFYPHPEFPIDLLFETETIEKALFRQLIKNFCNALWLGIPVTGL